MTEALIVGPPGEQLIRQANGGELPETRERVFELMTVDKVMGDEAAADNEVIALVSLLCGIEPWEDCTSKTAQEMLEAETELIRELRAKTARTP